MLLSAVWLGQVAPLLAQEGVGIAFDDLSREPTETTVDRFGVELSNLDAATTYAVVVASDNATALGIGACGTAAQAQTVTGVTAQDLAIVVYACALGSGTLTAEVRAAGAATAAATVSRALTVLAIPEGAPPGVPGAAPASAATRGATKAGTPGLVPSISFPTTTSTSIKVTWGAPSNGGRALTGYGLLLWRTGTQQPPWGDALVKGTAPREHTYTGLQPATSYQFRIHACNGTDSCGHWTHPPKEATTQPAPTATATPTPTATATARPTPAPTVGPPGQVQSLSTSNRTATSVTVHWSPHRDTGGRALTGFGLLRREQPNAWPPHDQATVVGAASRRHTFTRLKYGRGQGVQIRACNGANSCGAWSAEVTVTPLPGPLPTLALPKTTIAIGERMKIGANDVPRGAVAYIRLEGPIQPAGRCGASGTARVAPRAPSPSPGPGYYDSMWIDGCTPGGDAVVRLESQDGSVLYDRRELTVAAQQPGQVARPVVSPRQAALHVAWEVPRDGGTPTHYEVGYRAGTTGAWTEMEVRGRTDTTISGLTNGTSYQVRVQAVNKHGEGGWSSTATGTPQVDAAAPGNPGSGEPTLAPPACDEIPDPGSTTPSRLDQPTNLHVKPFRNRRAVLAWNPVAGAAKYVVQIRQRTATGWGNWLPPDRRANRAISGDVSKDNCYVIDLDRVITQTSGSSEGLAHSVAYGLRLRAVNGSVTSAASTDAIIIDSPIIEANGKSTAGAPRVKLKWLAIGTILGSDYSMGTYAFHHRRVGGNHQELGWTLDTFHPVKVFSQSSTNSDTIDADLMMEAIHAIQLRYEGTGLQRTSTVFAARDVYAWPSARAADGGERVATFPVNYRVKNRRYAYRICRDGYPGNFTHWKNLVTHALGHWQLATNGLISMVYEGEDCADYQTVLKRVRAVYENFVGQKLTSEQLEALEGLLESMDILTAAQVDDTELSEVIMVDQSATGIYGEFEAMGVFPEMSEELGIATCVFADPKKNRKPTACAWPRHNHPEKGWVTDILLPWDRFKDDIARTSVPGGLDADGGVTVDRDDVRFNTCGASVLGAYEVLVHEAGHVLGIRDARSVVAGWDNDIVYHHPSIYESVMSYERVALRTTGVTNSSLPDDPDCSPHPLDVLAIFAMYQQESPG
ncbi:MAG: fibronectin type III domain-containing protein [Chloroflexi bacterium]|nr:fibronectin type III domain-containing protein [Chloroflexota bacterium]